MSVTLAVIAKLGMASRVRDERLPSPYDAQIEALLRAEVRAAEQEPRLTRTSLFAASRPPRNEHDDLMRALEESTRDAAAPRPRASDDDDDERLRLALALSESTKPAAAAAAAAAPPRPEAVEEQLLREATAASEQAYLAERRATLGAVVGVMQKCAPILASYIEEHCGIFMDGDGAMSPDMEIEAFTDFRRTVDTLLADLLAEVGMGLDDVAHTLQLAREEPASEDGDGLLVEHLLAVESFSSFRRLMVNRNEAIHREARAAMPARPARAAGPDPSLLEESTAFATVRESGDSGPPTVEMVRIERERDERRRRHEAGSSTTDDTAGLPPSRLAEALAATDMFRNARF